MSNIVDKYVALKKSCRRKKSNLRPSEPWITPAIKNFKVSQENITGQYFDCIVRNSNHLLNGSESNILKVCHQL
ncbi:hypothetical protein P5673_025935 [Acropora cervicornis]|uniref:Uncharacterized protein n=1 Tax=Acropora cervicornis TaxID=6130 RepID=A0AAD9Q188_ACRCE|nr:hypothetical protein P5673_025935 [Acropora cervicornis]